MPYPNFHSCRIKEPNLFESDSFRTLKTKTKGLRFIAGKLKSTGKSAVQSFRYDKTSWTPSRAKNHCEKRDGSFEVAVKKSLTSSDIPNLLTPGGNTAFQGKGDKNLAYKLCVLECKERGKTEEETKEQCDIFKKSILSLEENINNYLDLPDLNKSFVYHHHWNDVDEYEAKCKEEDIGYNNSLLGELRLSMGDRLIGYSVHLGEPNESFPNDKLASLEVNNKLEVDLNGTHDKEWLSVKDTSIRKEIDEDNETWSAFFLVDKGAYAQGVKRKHFHEYFFDGEVIKGRYIFVYTPVNKINKIITDSRVEELFLEDSDNSVNLGERIWLVQKPKDQRPFAETHKLENIVAELKHKEQKWLVWSSPNIRSEKIDIDKFDLQQRKIDLFAEKECY